MRKLLVVESTSVVRVIFAEKSLELMVKENAAKFIEGLVERLSADATSVV